MEASTLVFKNCNSVFLRLIFVDISLVSLAIGGYLSTLIDLSYLVGFIAVFFLVLVIERKLDLDQKMLPSKKFSKILWIITTVIIYLSTYFLLEMNFDSFLKKYSYLKIIISMLSGVNIATILFVIFPKLRSSEK